MKKLFINQFAFCVVILLSCKDQDSSVYPGSVYQACCGVEPVEFVQDSYYIFVPNCFTPNGDGINDIFWAYTNINIDSVKSYEIFSDGGDVFALLYRSLNFSVMDWQTNAWDGRDLMAKIYWGKFLYYIDFKSKDGNEIKVKGNGCAISCDMDAKIFKNRKSCFFPYQVTLEGRLDSTIFNGELYCFGQ